MWKYFVEPVSPQMMGMRPYSGKLRPK